MDNTKPKGTFAKLMQSTPLPPPPDRAPPVPAEEQPIMDVPERVNARTPVRSNGKRIITRNSFEIYEDQMDALRRLSFADKMNGKIGSMSAMVRDAIDAYLKEFPPKK
jgi:hypothetical protein